MTQVENLAETEQLFFERFAGNTAGAAGPPPAFILGSPRTGSTLFYQVVINCFDFFYFTNLINDSYARNPVVGAALDLCLNPRAPASYQSSYGKTDGPYGPSEASLVFKNWFGGEHPSQTRSARVLPDQEDHLVSTMEAIHALAGRPILAKNAWNCFRIAELTRLFPQSVFLWIRRDITQSALSDLQARRRRGGNQVWNSATTANYLEIGKRPYWEQVVEQQYEYNLAVGRDLAEHAPGRFFECWYENLCLRPDSLVEDLTLFFRETYGNGLRTSVPAPNLRLSPGRTEMEEDRRLIMEYVTPQIDGRLKDFVFPENKAQVI